MLPRKAVTLLLVIGGTLLLTNPVWLFPHVGETQYTYERSTVTVENGTFTYAGATVPEFAEENSLTAVGCQPNDDEQPRACAFDHHLVSHDPITVPWRPSGVIAPEFVRVDGSYYRRIHSRHGSGGTDTVVHDVERVPPRTILSESAIDLSGQTSTDSDRLPLRIGISGDTVRSFEDLEETQLGRIYRSNRSYYTVVVTDERAIDHGVVLLRYELPRYLLVGVGVLLLTGALLSYLRGRL
jgi:hypothetical protein